MVPVRKRHLPTCRGIVTGSAARVRGAGQHVSDRLRAGVAGHPREQDRGTTVGRPFQRERPPADDDQHDRRPGGDHRLEQLLLATEEPELARSRNSPVVESAVSPERSTTTTIATSRWRASSTAAAISASVPLETRCRGRGGSRSRRARAERIEHRRATRELVVGRRAVALADDPERSTPSAHLAQRLHVDQVAVVAEQVARAVGDRSDDRDPSADRDSGSTPVVLDAGPSSARRDRARPRLLGGQALQRRGSVGSS